MMGFHLREESLMASFKEKRFKSKLDRHIRRVSQMLSPDVIIDIQTGVNGDIRHMTYPSGTQLGPYWTIDDVNAIGDFDCELDIMVDLVGAAIGRSVRMLMNQLSPEVLEDPEMIVGLMSSTDKLQLTVATLMVSQARERKPDWKINEEAKSTALAKLQSHMNEALGVDPN
jgi:hypothetical protein